MTDNETTYYHQDHLGSVNVITDKAGLARSLTEYDPFGKISRFEKYGSKIPSGWNFFNDKPLDDESGLMYYGARYYNPSLGRFITPDTIVPGASNPQNLNRYSYCGNNPVNFTDPSGHKKSWWHRFWSKYGDFISPLGRALVTHDWGHFGQQVLNTVGFVVGAATGNPFMIVASAVSYFNTATSDFQGGGWGTAHQVLGYTAIALSIGSIIADPPIDLGTIVIKGRPSIWTTIANGAQQAFTATAEFLGDHWAYIQTGLAVAGVVPGVGIGFDVASAGISAATGDFVGAGLSAVAAVPFGGIGVGLFRGARAEAGFARISRKAPEYIGGRISEDGFLRSAENYLGVGYKEVSPGRYLSSDGMRQVRYGKDEIYGLEHHAHFEAYNRSGGNVIENTRVKIE